RAAPSRGCGGLASKEPTDWGLEARGNLYNATFRRSPGGFSGDNPYPGVENVYVPTGYSRPLPHNYATLHADPVWPTSCAEVRCLLSGTARRGRLNARGLLTPGMGKETTCTAVTHGSRLGSHRTSSPSARFVLGQPATSPRWASFCDRPPRGYGHGKGQRTPQRWRVIEGQEARRSTGPHRGRPCRLARDVLAVPRLPTPPLPCRG